MTDPVRHAWQASAAEAPLPALADVRAGADRFHRIVRRRNAIEYAACVLVVVFFGIGVFRMHPLAAQIGAALIVLGTCVVAWQLHRRASAVAPPAADAARPILEHQRAQLARQRDALSGVGHWYLGPLVPGLALIMLAPVFHRGPAALLHMPPGALIGIAVNILVFTGIWWLNRHGARQLQKAIDEIDALTGDAP
jgi:hypothetical protein